MSTYVWYAGFGSNLASARLAAYLEGGVPNLDSAAAEELGARDASPPTHTDRMTVPHQLFFAHTSKKWNGGGVAFLDSASSATHSTRCRLSRITVEQLADVHAQEARRASPAQIDVDEVVARGHVDYFESIYGRLLSLGRHESGEAILTITTGQEHLEQNAPDPSYLRTIAIGLRETFGMDPIEIVEYLSAADGVTVPIDDPTWVEICR